LGGRGNVCEMGTLSLHIRHPGEACSIALNSITDCAVQHAGMHCDSPSNLLLVCRGTTSSFAGEEGPKQNRVDISLETATCLLYPLNADLDARRKRDRRRTRQISPPRNCGGDPFYAEEPAQSEIRVSFRFWSEMNEPKFGWGAVGEWSVVCLEAATRVLVKKVLTWRRRQQLLLIAAVFALSLGLPRGAKAMSRHRNMGGWIAEGA
jgi:hypothetical protein